jgi:hypothetical protein
LTFLVKHHALSDFSDSRLDARRLENRDKVQSTFPRRSFSVMRQAEEESIITLNPGMVF